MLKKYTICVDEETAELAKEVLKMKGEKFSPFISTMLALYVKQNQELIRTIRDRRKRNSERD